MEMIETPNLPACISRIEEAIDLDDLTTKVQTIISQWGFSSFSYWLKHPPDSKRQPIALATYPADYSKHYMKNKYYLHDMIGLVSNTTCVPFTWDEIEDIYSLTVMQKKLFDESASVGMKSGGCIPIHGPFNSHAVFSVVSDQTEKEFARWFNHCKQDIHMIALYIHDKVIKLEAAIGHKVVSMTTRELEVLTWVSRGKTYWETGKILNIKEDTVKKHIKKACLLLHASNSTQAVAKATVYGLISP